jgi:hypothetical protein
MANPRPKAKKTEQLGFKVDEELFADVEKAATNERRKRNELARLIFEWGFEKYKEAGSYDGLIGRKISRRN